MSADTAALQATIDAAFEDRANVGQATTGAAVARRQDWQWQTMLLAGVVVAE